MSTARLIVIKTQFRLGRLEAVLDRPAMPFDLDQCGNVGPGRAPSREKGKLTVGKAAADQKTSRPQAGLLAVVFGSLQIGQLTVGPVVQPCALATITCREALPSRRIEILRDRLGHAD